MSTTDYPDYQSSVQEVGFPLLSFALQTIPAGIHVWFGPQPLGYFQNAMIICQALTQPFWIYPYSATIESSTFISNNRPLYVPVGAVTVFVVPVLGNGIQVDTYNSGASKAGYLGVYPTNLPVGAWSYPQNDPLLYQWPTASIAVSSQLKVDVPAYFGDARLSIQNPNIKVAVEIDQFNASGAILGLSDFQTLAVGDAGTFDVYIPPGRSQLVVTNLDTSAGTTYIGLTAKL